MNMNHKTVGRVSRDSVGTARYAIDFSYLYKRADLKSSPYMFVATGELQSPEDEVDNLPVSEPPHQNPRTGVDQNTLCP